MEDGFGFNPPNVCDHPYTITEINAGIASLIESHNTLVWVEAEVSNWRRASSGHIYFKLKDETSQVPAVVWRSTAQKLKFDPSDGDAVMAIASIRVYQRGGYYQLDVHRMQPSGIGALYAAFEKLKTKLEAEGLFDVAHKRALPDAVRTVGVVTAKGGAAIRDIIKVIASRSPRTNILLRGVPVQGNEAPRAVAQAIRELNEHGGVDCIIVGRGGGSFEDLCAFNDESVARAVFESRIPVVSAVGHEVDITIADMVADVRAATPSAAAEIVVPDDREGRRYYRGLCDRFSTIVTRYLFEVRGRWTRLVGSQGLRRPARLLAENRQTLDLLSARQGRSMAVMYRHKHEKIISIAGKLHALSPLATLGRGYAVVEDNTGKPVRSSSEISPGERILIRLHEGEADADVVNTRNSLRRMP